MPDSKHNRLTCSPHSGTVPSLRCLSALLSVSLSVLSSQFSYLSAGRGPLGLVLVSVLDVRGKRQTVCDGFPSNHK